MAIRFTWARMAPVAALAALLLAGPAWADELKGMITHREGDQLTIRDAGGAQTIVTLTPSTKVEAVVGALGVRTEERATSDLIEGLPVTLETVVNGPTTEAAKVTFKPGDLKTARQVAAGTSEVREQAARTEAENQELRRRMSEANQYVAKGEATVYFDTGSAALSAQGKADLQALATKAKAIKGYWVGVVGHADPRGDPAANQRLSEQRAAAVIRYLQKACGLQPQRVLAGDAMGEAHLVAEASTPQGLAQNRRVVVTIMTNKGLEGL